MKILVVSHLYPSPGVERHLFVHEQILALEKLGVTARVVSPTPWAPRVLIANSNLVGRWANWDHFRELEAAGVDQFNLYLMNGDEEDQLAAYGSEIIPAFA